MQEIQEIKVVVNQDPGKVSWNYEEIKKWLKKELQIYRTTVYTDETIKTAKTDVANLRKLSKQVKDREKEIRDLYMEPFDAFDAQVSEIVSLIQEPIDAIKDQVDDYERRRKVKVRAEIMAYWQIKSAVIPEEIRENALRRIYDNRWENATATKKSWHEGIDNGVGQIQKDIETIKSFASEFEQEMIQTYYQAFSLADSMRKMHELDAQKQRILERERQRREAEERRKAEEAARREAEEKRRAEEEARQEAVRRIQYETPKVIPNPRHEEAQGQAEVQGMHESAPTAERSLPEPAQAQEQADNGVRTITLQITGTANQIQKIRGYISYIRAKQKEVSNGIDS